MTTMTAPLEISYGIYTIERLPKGSKRTPKWDLHSIAQDRSMAESHAKTLAAQPYFDHIEIQEFRVCSETRSRSANKIRTYSRHSSLNFVTIGSLAVFGIILGLMFL